MNGMTKETGLEIYFSGFSKIASPSIFPREGERVSRKFQKKLILGFLYFFTAMAPQINRLITYSPVIKNGSTELVMMVQMAVMMLNHLSCIAHVGLFVHEFLACPNKINS